MNEPAKKQTEGNNPASADKNETEGDKNTERDKKEDKGESKSREENASSDTSKKSLQGLDFLNLFMADVQTGLGPFLSIFLKTARHFNPAQVGMALAASSIAQVIAQAPMGAFIDKSTKKRLLVGGAAALVAVGAIMIALIPQVWAVVAAQSLIGGAGAVFTPAIAALTLGIVGRKMLTQRQSRNEAFNHTGNVLAALLFGFIGYKAPIGLFWCVVVLSFGTMWAVNRIQEQDIDHKRASGAEDEPEQDKAGAQGDAASDSGKQENGRADDERKQAEDKQKGSKQDEGKQDEGKQDEGKQEGLFSIFKGKRVLIFAASVVLFHSANAAMLPLVGQMLGGDKSRIAPLYMTACIIVAQLTMVPVALTVGKLAPKVGHKKIFLVGIASVVVRGLVFAFVRNRYGLIAVQTLDGVGAGIFGVLNVLIIASLMRGTGRFNFAQGAIAASTGIGGALSNGATGLLVKNAGYKTGFLALSVVAVIAFVFFLTLMPETNDEGKQDDDQKDDDQKDKGGA